MFSIMGNCVSWMKKRREPARKVTLAILGLDNAGKTVTTKGLQGENLESVAPTVGFSTVDFNFNKHAITLYDLGGGKRIREIWKSYFSEIYGLIYVVDSTDPERMDECRQVLANILEHPKVQGKPILLLANKQDKEGAMDELDVCQHLNLEEIVNINKCPCRVETCSAILGQGRKLDKAIKNGMTWLLNTVNLQWEKLNVRVERDVAEQREAEQIEKKRRQEAVRKKREERERKEKEERRLRGEPSTDEEEETEFKNGDPFRTVDLEELKKKEQRLKEEKRRKKEKNSRRAVGSDDSDEKPAPRSSKSHSRSHSDRERIVSSDEDEDNSRRRIRKSKKGSQSYRSRTPSPDGLPRLNRRKLGEKSLSDDEYGSSLAARSPWLKKRSPRPADGFLPAISPRLTRALTDDDSIDRPSRARGRSLMPIGHLEPLDADSGLDGASIHSSDFRVDGRRKKKKKRTRRNQIAAAEDEDGNTDTASIASNDTSHSYSNYNSRSWNPPPVSKPSYKASRSPRLATAQEEPEAERDSFSQRWGLAEDLGDLPDNASYRRTRPNMDSDDDIVT